MRNTTVQQDGKDNEMPCLTLIDYVDVTTHLLLPLSPKIIPIMVACPRGLRKHQWEL